MARYFDFNKLSSPGGLFNIRVINQSNEQLILNAIDKDFYPYAGQTLGWEAFASGSSINHNTGTFELEVTGGCRLNGAAEIDLFNNGGWYRIGFDVFFTVGINHRVRILAADGTQLYQTALSQGGQYFYFKAANYPRGIIFIHSDTGGTRSFRLDNVSIEPVAKCSLIGLSDIEMGNDGADDDLMYPGNCTIAIKLKEKLFNNSSFRDNAISLKNNFIDYDTFLILERFNSVAYDRFFTGKLDNNDIQFSADKGTYNFRMLDDLATLKNSRAINNTQTFNKVKLSDFIAGKVNSLGVGRTVIFKMKWQAWDANDTSFKDIEEFYIDEVGLEYRNNPFTNDADVLKSVLANLGAYGLATPDYKFYVLPKFQNDEMEIETLYDDEMPELKLFQYNKDDGLNFYEHDGLGNYIEPDPLVNSYKDIYLPFPCSNVDMDVNNRSLTLFLTSNLHLVVSRYGIRYKINSSTWSATGLGDGNDFKFYLNQIHEQTKLQLNKGVIAKPGGLTHAYNKFYEILKSRSNPVRLIDTVFRPVNFKFDIKNNQTEITLIPAPALVF